jgi:hypothetical protein
MSKTQAQKDRPVQVKVDRQLAVDAIAATGRRFPTAAAVVRHGLAALVDQATLDASAESELASFFLTVKSRNTEEWMESARRRLDIVAAKTGQQVDREGGRLFLTETP